jgi:hypothetical protein
VNNPLAFVLNNLTVFQRDVRRDAALSLYRQAEPMMEDVWPRSCDIRASPKTSTCHTLRSLTRSWPAARRAQRIQQIVKDRALRPPGRQRRGRGGVTVRRVDHQHRRGLAAARRQDRV